MRSQSVSSKRRARAWQAAMAACSTYGPGLPPQGLGALERRQPAANQQLVPAGPVLVGQQDRLAARPDAGGRPGCLDLHQRHQAVHLGLARGEPGQDPAQPQGVLAQRRPHPVVAGGGRVALVEDQVDDLEHGGQPAASSSPWAPRTARRRWPASSWPARSVAPRSVPAPGRPGRSRRWSGRRAAAGSARRGPPWRAPGGRRRTPGRSRSSPMSSSSATIAPPGSIPRSRPTSSTLR